MSKRSRISRDQLTGGSYDVNPQTLLLNAVKQPANDTLVTAGTGLPIPRLPIKQGRSLVMELLRASFIVPNSGYVAGAQTWISGILTTNPEASDNHTFANNQGLGFFNDPRTIAQVGFGTLASAAPTAIDRYATITEVDLTDEAGHGYLVATDNLYIALSSQATATQQTMSVDVTYRFKDVSLEEYIGIVQSQQ